MSIIDTIKLRNELSRERRLQLDYLRGDGGTRLNYICTNYAVGEIPLLMIPDGVEYCPDGSSRKRWLLEASARTILEVRVGDVLLSAYVPEDGTTMMIKLTERTKNDLDRLITEGHEYASRMADMYGKDVDLGRYIWESVAGGGYTSAVQRGRMVSFCCDGITERVEYWSPDGENLQLPSEEKCPEENRGYVIAQNYIVFSRFYEKD